jgi:hypothetical protein
MSTTPTYRFAPHVSAAWQESITKFAAARGQSVPDALAAMTVVLPSEETYRCSACQLDKKVIGIAPKRERRSDVDPWQPRMFLTIFRGKVVELSDTDGNSNYICPACLKLASSNIGMVASFIIPMVKKWTGNTESEDPDIQAAMNTKGAKKGVDIVSWIMDLLGSTADSVPEPRSKSKMLPPAAK